MTKLGFDRVRNNVDISKDPLPITKTIIIHHNRRFEKEKIIRRKKELENVELWFEIKAKGEAECAKRVKYLQNESEQKFQRYWCD